MDFSKRGQSRFPAGSIGAQLHARNIPESRWGEAYQMAKTDPTVRPAAEMQQPQQSRGLLDMIAGWMSGWSAGAEEGPAPADYELEIDQGPQGLEALERPVGAYGPMSTNFVDMRQETGAQDDRKTQLEKELYYLRNGMPAWVPDDLTSEFGCSRPANVNGDGMYGRTLDQYMRWLNAQRALKRFQANIGENQDSRRAM